jgi:hypothetical protein
MRAANRKSQSGVALLMCMFALMLLAAVAMGLMFMSNTETNVNSNYRSEQQAYYGAKAGLEEMRDRMRWGNSYTIPLPTVMPSTTTTAGVTYILNPDDTSGVIQPWNASNKYFDDELCHENFSGLGLTAVTRDIPCTVAPSGTYYNTYTSLDPGTGTASALSYKWVRLTMKQNGTDNPYCVDTTCTTATLSYEACYDDVSNAQEVVPTLATACESMNPPLRPVYMVTALAVNKTGSRRMVQAEVASVALPPLPAAITFDGAAPIFGSPSSGSLRVQGDNANSCGPPGPNMPGLGAYNAQAVSSTSPPGILQQIPSNKANDYQGSSGSTPDVQNVGPTGLNMLGPLATVGGLQSLVTNITATADQVFPGGYSGSINLGTSNNPMVTVIQGNYNLGNNSGAGLLLVTGTLTFSGNPNWNGIILVIGQGAINTGSGGGNGQLNGGILVANLYNSAGAPLPASSAPGVPTINWRGGGTYNVNYDSCWINNLSNRLVLKAVASREALY